MMPWPHPRRRPVGGGADGVLAIATAIRRANELGFLKGGNCGFCVLKMQAMKVWMKGSVFHVQRMIDRAEEPKGRWEAKEVVTYSRHKGSNRVRGMAVGVGLVVLQAFWGVSHASDKECIDFYTVGDSKCETSEASPNTSSSSPELVRPAAAKSEEQKIDEYLENYGKPPREFVQFYMNPTPENAKKWVEAYKGVLQKSQNLSRMWEDAERLYGQQGATPALRRPATVTPVVVPAAVPPASSGATLPRAQASQLGNFGGLNAVPVGGRTEGVMPQDRGLKLTYYFSQTCPFCARMTPELSVLTNNYSGKLEFTCVDVTPFSGATAPNPAYLRDKLACHWRLPEGDELQREGVTQTPTLLIQPGGKAQVKLSGYMSQEQLKPYFAR